METYLKLGIYLIQIWNYKF